MINEVSEAIAEVMKLAYLVNMKTDYCVFVDFSGHIDKFEISITPNKSLYTEIIAESKIVTNEEPKNLWGANTIENTLQRLSNVCETLKETLSNGRIEISNLPYGIKEEKVYQLG